MPRVSWTTKPGVVPTHFYSTRGWLTSALQYADKRIIMSNDTTFGRTIARARKDKGLSQKELAALIKRDDKVAISPQYLNDIEHDRRSPSSDHLVQQFAATLDLDCDYLYYLSNRLPEDIRDGKLSQQEASQLMTAFRRKISKK